MKQVFRAILALLALASAGAATASNTTAFVNILFLNYTASGIAAVFVSITQGTNVPIANIPACVSANNIGNTYDYVFDATTNAGKALLAGLIAAHTAGVSVRLVGTGTCAVQTGNETLSVVLSE
jgi:hypothetical protein